MRKSNNNIPGKYDIYGDKYSIKNTTIEEFVKKRADNPISPNYGYPISAYKAYIENKNYIEED